MKFLFPFLLVLLISTNLIAQDRNIFWKNGFSGDIINVKSEGAKGDGHSDDTQPIQAALDKIYNKVISTENHSGGTVYFPSGVYIISRPLKIPQRCSLIGLSGVFTQTALYDDVTKIYQHQPIVIRLADNSNCNMVEPYELKDDKFVSYESVVISGLAFDGNLDNQTSSDLKGIYLPDRQAGIRPNLIIRDVFIFRVKGYGLYAGTHNSEFVLENVLSDLNEIDGYYFAPFCQDVVFSRVMAGSNKRDGFHFERCGAFRLMNCDSWSNGKNGIYIFNGYGFSFNTLTCDMNYESGARLEGSGIISFVNANFTGNSYINRDKVITSPQFPEVDVLPNQGGYGSFAVKFIGCRFGSMDSTQKTLCAIRDQAEVVRNNSLIGCTFLTKSLNRQLISNSKVQENYIIQGCTGGVDGQEGIIEQQSPRTLSARGSVQTDIALTKNNNVLLVNTSENSVSIQLPGLNEIPEGKEFIIIKTDKNNEITLKPRKGDLLNGSPDSKQIAGEAYSERKIINAGNTWVLVN